MLPLTSERIRKEPQIGEKPKSRRALIEEIFEIPVEPGNIVFVTLSDNYQTSVFIDTNPSIQKQRRIGSAMTTDSTKPLGAAIIGKLEGSDFKFTKQNGEEETGIITLILSPLKKPPPTIAK